MEEENINQPQEPTVEAPAQTPEPPEFKARKWPFVVIGFLLLIILLMSGFFMATRKTAVEPTPTPAVSEQISPTNAPTLTPAPGVFEGKDIYDSDKPFTLNFPDSCKLGDRVGKNPLPGFPDILCQNGIEIIPNGDHYGWGEGPNVTPPQITTDTITLNGNIWKRTVYQIANKAPSDYDLALYDLDGKQRFYIEVHYSNYSKEAQDSAESIISTFKFTQ